jgi:hypothetical protein
LIDPAEQTLLCLQLASDGADWRFKLMRRGFFTMEAAKLDEPRKQLRLFPE